jgi:hypothetical protein
MRTTRASTTLLGAAALTLAACSVDTTTAPVDPPVFDRAADVAMCHRNEDTAGFEFLMVPSNGKAVEKHIAHGDAYPGDPIPAGFTPSGADCSLPFLAIAYTDRDPSDGDAYQAGIDRLIAVLLDTNGDKAPNAGGEVYVFGFPLDFAASAFGSVGVPSHTVGNVVRADCGYHAVYSDQGGLFEWQDAIPSLGTYFNSETPDGFSSLFLSDRYNASSSDWISVVAGSSPTQPDRDVVLADASTNDTDNAFLDIQIVCGG